MFDFTGEWRVEDIFNDLIIKLLTAASSLLSTASDLEVAGCQQQGL